MRRSLTSLLAVLSVVAAACDSSSDLTPTPRSTSAQPTATTVAPPTTAAFQSIWEGRQSDELILTVNDPTGPIPSALIARRPPLFALYGDGTVLVHADQASYLRPGEFLIPLRRVRLDQDMRNEVDALVNDVKLPSVTFSREDRPGAFDFGTMRAEYITGGGTTHVYEAYALEKTGSGFSAGTEDGWPSPETHALGRLAALLHPLGYGEEGEAYAPERVAILLYESAGAPFTEAAPWPLPVAPDAMEMGPPLGNRRCATLSGPALEEALPFLGEFPADRLVRIDQYGEIADAVLWMVGRVLLPSEPSCGAEISSFG